MNLELELHAIKARAMAHEAVFNVILVNWGEPRAQVMAYLNQTAERLEATGLPQNAPEQALDAIREVMALAKASLLASPPDAH